MRGLVFLGERRLELREFPEPKPGFSEVVIQMRASGICGTDLKRYRAPLSKGADPSALPASGHEPCGEVIEIGPGVRKIKVGDRILPFHYLGCGHCRWCNAGYFQLCIDPEIGHLSGKNVLLGTTCNGSNADRIAIDETMCILMPDELSYEEGAACACVAATAHDALQKLNVSGRDTLAIYGQGPVGLSTTVLAVATGARVIVVEPSAYRRELAKSLGCAVALDPRETDPVETIKGLTNGEGADATLDSTGIAETRVNTIRSARIYGRACFVGTAANETSFNVHSDIQWKQLTIYGTWTTNKSGMAEFAHYVADRKVPLKKIITHRFRLEQAAEAYKLFDAGETGKVVFTWE